IVEQKLLVYKHSGAEDTEDIHFHVTVNFEGNGDETKITMKMVFETSQELERVKKEFGAVEGLEQTLTRLGEYLLQQ
ncbi:MAG: ATPase, partial [Melioribacteraceae bacterium]